MSPETLGPDCLGLSPRDASVSQPGMTIPPFWLSAEQSTPQFCGTQFPPFYCAYGSGLWRGQGGDGLPLRSWLGRREWLEADPSGGAPVGGGHPNLASPCRLSFLAAWRPRESRATDAETRRPRSHRSHRRGRSCFSWADGALKVTRCPFLLVGVAISPADSRRGRGHRPGLLMLQNLQSSFTMAASNFRTGLLWGFD